MPDTILEENHPKIISAKFGWDWLLRNHWTNCNQTLVEWSLHDPLPNLCPVIPTFNQDGRQAENRKKGNELVEGPNRRTHFWKRTIQWLFHQNLVLIEQMVSDKKMFMGISHRVCWNDPWVVPFQKCVQHFRPPMKMAATTEPNLT
jgi:hypothetical protein